MILFSFCIKIWLWLDCYKQFFHEIASASVRDIPKQSLSIQRGRYVIIRHARAKKKSQPRVDVSFLPSRPLSFSFPPFYHSVLLVAAVLYFDAPFGIHRHTSALPVHCTAIYSNAHIFFYKRLRSNIIKSSFFATDIFSQLFAKTTKKTNKISFICNFKTVTVILKNLSIRSKG